MFSHGQRWFQSLPSSSPLMPKTHRPRTASHLRPSSSASSAPEAPPLMTRGSHDQQRTISHGNRPITPSSSHRTTSIHLVGSTRTQQLPWPTSRTHLSLHSNLHSNLHAQSAALSSIASEAPITSSPFSSFNQRASPSPSTISSEHRLHELHPNQQLLDSLVLAASSSSSMPVSSAKLHQPPAAMSSHPSFPQLSEPKLQQPSSTVFFLCSDQAAVAVHEFAAPIKLFPFGSNITTAHSEHPPSSIPCLMHQVSSSKRSVRIPH